ncbi:MAG: peroxiredoxin family protein [Candidatus Saccharicenans sp.]|uniref:peroxiredoxin family protein n=1 Tax=Candidatus Saccharicenans sp. TaxID=2819258 RepID=UPI0040498220
MKKTPRFSIFLTICLVFCFFFITSSARSQEQQFRPALLEQPMRDFALPSYQGPEVRLSGLKGKNLMLIFPRGYAAPDRWCTICHYKYMELVELEKTRQIRKQYNLEIIFVLPYPRDIIKLWLESLPEQMTKIKNWKYPENLAQLDEKGKQAVERYRQIFPGDFTVSQDNIPMPFPILIDTDHQLSSRLGLFTTSWGGSQVEQNIPAVYLIDEQGILRFKYVSQNTLDRPEYEYLLKILEMIRQKKL